MLSINLDLKLQFYAKAYSPSFRFSLRQTSATRASLINSGLEDNSILIPASSQGYCVLISKSWRVWAEHYKDRAWIQISFLRLKQQPIGLGWVQDCKFLTGWENSLVLEYNQDHRTSGWSANPNFYQTQIQHHRALANCVAHWLSLCELYGQLTNCHSWFDKGEGRTFVQKLSIN